MVEQHSIALVGGSGFVGSEVAKRLMAAGHSVTVISRSAKNKPISSDNPVNFIAADVHNQAALSDAIEGHSCVVNLVGILNEFRGKGNSFKESHTTLTRNIISACEQHGCHRLIQISALNAGLENTKSKYLITKGEAEAAIRSSQLQYTIYQPSIIFGPDDSFFNRFAALARLAPVLPMAVPCARFAPVYVGDIADTVVNSIDDTRTFGRTFELIGPEEFSLRELVDYTVKTAGLRTVVINMPDFASKLQGQLLQFVPGKPFSLENYHSLQHDSVGSNGTARQKTSVQMIAPSYLKKKTK